MSREQDQNQTPIEGKGDLVQYLVDGFKPASARGIGTEHEKFGIVLADYSALPYAAPVGLEAVLTALAKRPGAEVDYDNGHIMAIVNDGGAVTLEPGGQFELSGGVTRTIHETAAELDVHLDSIRPISEELGIEWLGTGCRPIVGLDNITWMPKTRYKLMAPFLESRGGLAHHMMMGTCTVQANLDYIDEADCTDMVSVASRISPIVSAIFANSSIIGGVDSGFQSYRCHIWTDTDPARSGTPDFMLSGMTFEEYVDYLLDIPVMFVRRDDAYHDAFGVPFRTLLSTGIRGTPATMGDWELHVSTTFPDVRIKQFVEVRGADGGGRESILGLPALWKGILYDEQARAEASELIGPVTPQQHAAHYAGICKDGLRAQLTGRSCQSLASGLLDIAAQGLDRLAESAETERIFLEPVMAWVRRGESPADVLRRVWQDSGGDPQTIIEAVRI